ncbi:polysaccharide lyase 8 family protein [Photobacterium rosenbergii]|uniref:Polysaccharide lyase 8 family protein n=1 Tax=Photobacterium rosenbergii TaxID=294936 RepID=A0ABU3ZDG9_9GAMM|nr:polysaccharide lyase 8 family protein [Photobacterium rosenbergii]MDV5168141.1 polysaccharide lyase 8 family protein [Photobacterium rosenbergii]
MRTLPLVVSITAALAMASLPVWATTADTNSQNRTELTGAIQRDFQELRLRWAENYLGDPDIPFDDRLNQMVVSTNNNAYNQWQAMNTNVDRESLWDDLWLNESTEEGRVVLGQNIRASYQRIFTMAKAYRLRDGQYQNDPELLAAIVDGMDFLNTHYYKVGAKEWGNWWNWELGTPRDVHNILSLIYDDVPQSLVTNHLNATEYFTPEATHLGAGPGAAWSTNPNYRESTGGNRTDNTQVVLLRGVLGNNAAEIEEAIAALPPVLEYVTTSDGFYQDGSFLQHYDIAYNGTYGNVLLNGLGLQLNLVAGSPWEATDPALQEVYPIIYKSYEPLLYKGTMLEFVNGRAISRPQEQGHDVGHQVMRSILHYIDGATPEDKARLESMLKTLINEDTFQDFFSSTSNVVNYQKSVALVNDDTIPERGELIGHYSYPSMERAIHRRDGWLFSVAMHSSRLGNYECMNEENRKGWYTGDGMTYLYNTQLGHYTDFWPVVDSYKLEGTTVDSQQMQECEGQRNEIKGGRKADMDWVGTLKLGDYGIAGMDFYNWDETLTAKKSWFMLDDGVVMLGSDIESSIGAELSTVIANRKVADEGLTNIYVNGELWENSQGSLENVLTLSIRNAELAGSDLSYVFLAPTDLELKRELRLGDWSDIGTRDGEASATFISAEQKHESEHNSYAYVLLPNASSQSLEQFSENPQLDILQNDHQAHAIFDHSLELLAANVWSEQEVVINPLLTTYSPMAIMLQGGEDDELKVAVTDPLQIQTFVRFKLGHGAQIKSDPQGRVQQHSETEFVVDVSGLQGMSYQFTVK